MAGLTQRQKTGEWIVKFYDDHVEKTVFVGRMQKRSAEEVRRHIERLVEAKRADLPP